MGQLERQDKGYEDEASKDIYSRESFESVDIRQIMFILTFFTRLYFFFLLKPMQLRISHPFL